jgi:hypothetical protein
MPSREKKPSKKVAKKALVEPKAIQSIVAVEPVASVTAVESVPRVSRDKTPKDRVVALPKLNEKPDALSAIITMSEGLELVYSCLSDIDSGVLSQEDQKEAVYEMYAEMMSLSSDSKALLTSFRRYYKVKERDVIQWLSEQPDEDGDEDEDEDDDNDEKKPTIPSIEEQVEAAAAPVAQEAPKEAPKQRKKRQTKINYDHAAAPENASKMPSVEDQLAHVSQ